MHALIALIAQYLHNPNKEISPCQEHWVELAELVATLCDKCDVVDLQRYQHLADSTKGVSIDLGRMLGQSMG